MSKRIDLAWMIRTGKARPGQLVWGTLCWNFGDEPAGSISYEADMREAHASELRLSYTRGPDDNREHVKQTVRLTFTEPNFGGRRWWMTCPYRGHRVGKLYMPNGGDRFASRTAWRLGYRSQRIAKRDVASERLFRLQRKLGCDAGWEAGIRRPKGMWNRTFERHFDRCMELDEAVGWEMMALVNRLNDRLPASSKRRK